MRPLRDADLPVADHIMRVAFGTFIGLPEPASFLGDAAYVKPRLKAAPDSAFAAEMHGEVVGSNFATNWGSFGFFGPLTIRPDLWDRGIGRRLMEPIIACFERWGTKHAGLFTFPHSQKHIGLYQKYGFYPRFLTALMSKPVHAAAPPAGLTTFSELPASERGRVLDACHQLTSAILDGLDVTHEIRAVADQDLGDTVLLLADSNVAAFGVCHTGAGTEAGSDTCYIKFGAVRPGFDAGRNFTALLRACEEMAHSRKASRLVGGVNTAREAAYREMLAHGFRTDLLGVAMQKPNEPGFNRADAYVIDDWR